ncbi:hypothetical protein CL622_03510 [archaeon]|nr:hypothetical protein [archaeon]|tara:strand:+ start:302 stop:547 length:246 start_codon:yes stop_codon:yes gene_type:complete
MIFPVRLKVSYHTGELDGDAINSVESTHVLECMEDLPVVCNFLDNIGVETYSQKEVVKIIDMLEQAVSNQVMWKELHFRLI